MTATYTYAKPKSGIYEFVYNLPKELRKPGEPTQKRVSLKTRCPEEAVIRVGPYIELYVKNKTVRDLPKGKVVNRDMVVKQAKLQNLDYLDYKELEALPTEEFVEAAMERASRFKNMKAASQIEVATLLGEVVEPLTFMSALQRYWTLSPERTTKLGMTPLKANTKLKRDEQHVRDFIATMGDIDLLKLEPSVCADYRAKLILRGKAGKFGAEYAQWRIDKLTEIVRKVFKYDYRKRENPFDELEKIDADAIPRRAEKRKPFLETEIDHVNEELTKSKLTQEAKDIIVVSQMTGAIASEIAGLLPEDINVYAEIPHIIIRPNHIRSLKNDCRPRILPLFGAMLDVLKRYPNGFDLYHDERGLQRLNRHLSDFYKRVTPGKSMYSNRHRMEDCMKAIGLNGGIRSEIKGHAVSDSSEDYGTNRDILDIRDAMQKALTEGATKKREKERRMTNQKV